MKFTPESRSSSVGRGIQQPVPPEFYSREYFLADNSGFQLWENTGGTVLESRHEYALARAKLTPCDTVLDYGCGRREIVLHAARCGAKTLGVDYAPAAIDLARQTIKRAGLYEGDQVQLLLLEEKHLPFPEGAFTKILCLDVLEHLTPMEVSAILPEFYRVMATKGRLILHTAPNRIYYDYAYPRFTYPVSRFIDRLLEKARGRGFYNLSKDPRTASEKIRHINEQDFGSLKRSLRKAGFQCKAWASDRLLDEMIRDPRYVASRLLIKPSFWPLNYLFASDLWAIAWKS